MKVVFYQGQKKYTIDNVVIPDTNKLSQLLQEEKRGELNLQDLKLWDLRIISTRAALQGEESIDDEELEREVEEGINWTQETVN